MKFPPPIPKPRRADGSLLPALASLALGLGLVAQLAWPEPPLPLPAARRLAHIAPEPDLAALPDFPAIADAPVFAPGRGAGSVGDNAIEGYTVLGSALSRDYAKLAVRERSGALALLDIGDSLRGWTLSGIGGQDATFEKDGRQRIVPYPRPMAANTNEQPRMPPPEEPQ